MVFGKAKGTLKNLNKLVTICLATYNGAKYLDEQLDSIMHQTYSPIELLVQDDCSTDNTVKILHSYKDKLNISIFQNKKNVGFIKNFETIIQRANGDFISICDQDDIWEKDKIELLVENIDKATLIYSDSLLINHDSNSLNLKLSQSFKKKFISTTEPTAFLTENCVSGHATLFKKELLKYIFPFPPNIFFDTWIAANAASLHGVKFYNKCLVKYRQHDTNTLSKHIKKTEYKKNTAINKLENIRLEILVIESLMNLPLIRQKDLFLLNALKYELNKFENTWFNINLFKILYFNKKNLFQITNKNHLRLSLKKSIGYRLYKILNDCNRLVK